MRPPDTGLDASAPRSTTPPHPSVWRRLFPWASLIAGAVGAALMDRSPERAPIVAAGAVLLWLTLTVRIALGERRDPLAGGRIYRLLHASALFATQSLMQLALYFSLPFYFLAIDWRDPGHLVFMAVLGAIALIALWDPWTERLLARPLTGQALPTIATFLGLAVALPGLGLSNRQTLWSAAGAATVGALAAGIAWHRNQPSPRRGWGAVAAAAAMPLFLALGGARLIPAAPMRLVDATFGTTTRGHWVADPVRRLEGRPGQLVCATAIFAPLGIHESLWHVWKHNRREVQRIELDIVGGREAGFRTRSRRKRVGAHPEGKWRCTVRTEMGQVLGGTSLVIGGGPTKGAQAKGAQVKGDQARGNQAH